MKLQRNIRISYEKIPFPIFIVDTNDGKILYANDKYKKIVGDNIVGKYCKNIMGWCIRDYFQNIDITNVETENFIFDINNNKLNLIINAEKYKSNIVCYLTDVTKLKEYNNNLIKINNELEEIKKKSDLYDNSKFSFLSSVSHEIKTPLNSIIGFTRLLLNNKISNKTEYLQIIENNIDNLLNLIDTIIDLSRIEVKQIEIFNNKCVLKDIIDNVHNKYDNKLKNNDIEFYVDDDLPNVVIYSDEIRIKQILNNFLSNSFKFTDSGYVKIGYYLDKKDVVFYVEDTGIGIDKKNYDYIFDLFTQVDNGDKKNYGGSGLGLSINKKLVELIGGKIWLKSVIGEGTIFYFSIPSDYSNKIENKKIYNYKWENKKILIIDNDDYFKLLIINLFDKTGVEYDMVDNGIDGINKIKDKKYDLIITNIILPDIHSFELIKLIKKMNKDCKVLLLSIYDIGDIYIKKEFDYFVNKPINDKYFMDKINKIL